MRIGHGYDVHRLVFGKKLVLGGITIPFDRGLLGHSDADVLLHAAADALLGAAALGDIGQHFPDCDGRYKGISSLVLLEEAASMVFGEGFSICNIDCTIVAQKPRLAPYIQDMRVCMSRALGITLGQVNIKATTEEGLGFTGQELGIAAHAVVLLE